VCAWDVRAGLLDLVYQRDVEAGLETTLGSLADPVTSRTCLCVPGTDSWRRPKVVCALFSNRGPGAVWAISQVLDLTCYLYSCQTMPSAAIKSGRRNLAKGKAKGRKRPARKASPAPCAPTRPELEGKTVADLRALCADAKLSTTGVKAAVVHRLLVHYGAVKLDSLSSAESSSALSSRARRRPCRRLPSALTRGVSRSGRMGP
jgi:hypothetical protein